MTTELAFDAVAHDYDGPRGNNALIREMREPLRSAVLAHAPAGARVLDLGCGTGLDLAFFAGRGFVVHGVDLSREMIAKTEARIASERLTARATAEHLDLTRLAGPPRFDVAYSNLGPLNCVDPRAASRAIASALVPGGVLIASVIGRLCPWELGWYLAKRRLSRALVRFARGPVEVPLDRHAVSTRYFTPRELAACFREFKVTEVRALNVLRPPPYLDDVAERHPRFFDSVGRLEDRVAGWPIVRNFGDSFLITLKRI